MHNRKLKRIRKVFAVLGITYDHFSPFQAKSLFRKEREEQNSVQRRLAFSREQEEQLLQALDDPNNVVINKREIKIIYILGMNAGQRMKDCALLRWDTIDLAVLFGVLCFSPEGGS